MTTFGIIFYQLLNFFLLIAVGFVAAKKKVISQDGMHTLAKLFTSVLLPCFFFITLYRAFTWQELLGVAPMLVITFCIYAFYAILFAVLSVVFKVHKKRRKVFQAMFAFINIPAIGFPLIGVLYPDAIGVYIPAITLVDSLLVWTYGVWLTTDTEKTGKKAKFNPKRLINPVTVMVILALIVTLADIHVPKLILNPITALSKASNPVCMLYLGALIASTDLKKIFSYKEIYLGIGIKMLLFPLLMAPLFKSLPISHEMVNVSLILASLPAMSSLPVLVKENGTQVEFATSGTLVTTLASVVTMSIVAYFGMI